MSVPLLTITASNKNRLKLDELASQWFIKSIQWQDCKDFELLIADGGSDNYEEIKEYFESHDGPIKMSIVKHEIGDVFLRATLNNVGIRNSRTDYIMTTDVDMLFARGFVNTLVGLVKPNCLVESRTMYLKQGVMKEIYAGIGGNPYENVECLKRGRIKKRTTAGGCQCLHKDSWEKIRGFDESYYGWGSEDYDLYARVSRQRWKIKWMGESREAIELFHQHHHHPNLKEELKHQSGNKKRLATIGKRELNPDGWGGVKDEELK